MLKLIDKILHQFRICFKREETFATANSRTHFLPDPTPVVFLQNALQHLNLLEIKFYIELRRQYHDGIRLAPAKIILADKYRYAKQTRYPFIR